MKCKDCKHLIKSEGISLMSKLIGYTGQCSRTGILFKLEATEEAPLWCPLKEDKNLKDLL